MNSAPCPPPSASDGPFRFEGSVDVSTVATWHRSLTDFLTAARDNRIDLGAVTSVDLFGLQLLLSARSSASAAGRALTWQNSPACIQETCTRAGIDSSLFEPSRT